MKPSRPSLLVALALVVAAVASAFAGGDGRDSEPQRTPATGPTGAPPAPARAPGKIRTSDVQRHLRALASAARASGGNRAAGTAGSRASEEYAASVLREAGWRLQTQRVRFPFFEEERPPSVRLRGGARLRPRSDMRTMTYSGSGTVGGRVRPVGLAPGRASAAGCRRGDFARLRRGEIALVQRGTCTLRTKARNAQASGASAVLVPNDGLPGRTDAIRGTLGSPGIRIPVLALSTDAGTRVARAGRARVSVRATSERRTTSNLIAEAGEGERVVMAGAHLDSVTDGPGLNDNASGTAALLAAAVTLRSRVPDGARIRLALWGAEELGLYGSRQYVRGLDRAQRRAIRAYVNLDMVGTPRGRPSVYAGDRAVAAALRSGLRRRGRARLGSRSVGSASDHAPFRRAGIPVGGVFTGLDRCYHKRCDGLDNVDPDLVADIAAATATGLLAVAR